MGIITSRKEFARRSFFSETGRGLRHASLFWSNYRRKLNWGDNSCGCLYRIWRELMGRESSMRN